MSKLNLLVIAGSNGAGKTTFAKNFLKKYPNCEQFINSDLIASGLSPIRPESASIEAGKFMLTKINKLMKEKQNFSFETTLSGKLYLRIFKMAKKQGYQIHLVYLYLESPDFAIKRIKERVNHGGHNVDDKDVKRRFYRSLNNLFNLYWDIFDAIDIIDNSNINPTLIATIKNNKLILSKPHIFDKMKEMSHYEKK